MDYRGDLADSNRYDPWSAAIGRAFDAFNRPDGSRESELAFVEDLPEPLRFALVCHLYEAEINNGGLDLVFSCIGLLIPEIVSALSYFGRFEQSRQLENLVSRLGFEQFPRTHEEVMESWDGWNTDEHADDVQRFEFAYAALEEKSSTRAAVEAHIGAHPSLFFRNTRGTEE